MNKIRKIELESLINILEDLYNSGVNYVDFNSEVVDDQDIISISIIPEYIMDDEVDEPSNIIFDEDISDLI
jgi:hypothetical protein